MLICIRKVGLIVIQVADCNNPPLFFCVFLLKNIIPRQKFSKTLEKFTKKFYNSNNKCKVA